MTTLQTAGEAMEAAQKLSDLIAAQAVEIERLRANDARYRNFIDDMCSETFDTWTTGYRMQQIALNIQAVTNKELT